MISDGGIHMKKVMSLFIMLSLLIALPVNAESKRDLHDEIIYDILIDRFNIGDLSLDEEVREGDPFAYQGGDFLGITKKLDRVNELGFTSIVLSSVMKNSDDGYHGYWIEDFFEVEPQFGTLEDLNTLIEEAHERDIKVILEFVTNYVSDVHPFVSDSDKEDWFKENTVAKDPSTEWLDKVEVLDQENPEVESFLFEVADFWMKETNIDGFKLNDVDISAPSFIEAFTEHVNEINPDFYVLGGISEGADDSEDEDNLEFLDAVESRAMFEKMNEIFIEADQPVSALYDTWVENGKQDSNLIFIDNQNTARFSNNFAEKDRNALTTWKLALAYMYTTPGIPVVFQGSELPMYGPSFEESQILVQFNSTNPDIEEYYDRISSLRKEFKPLSHGDFELVGSDEGMSLFTRTYEDETLYVAINNDGNDRTVSITDLEADKQLNGVLGDNLIRENANGEYNVSLSRESADVFLIEDNEGLNWLFIGFILGVFALFIGFVIFLSHKQKKNQ